MSGAIFFMLILWPMPVILAFARSARSRGKILVFTILAGWFFPALVLLMIWAFRSKSEVSA